MSIHMYDDEGQPEVGGTLDEHRLRRIAVRALELRNMMSSPESVFEDLAKVGNPDREGETPELLYYAGDDGETTMPRYELHVGCGDICGVLAEFPYDGDSGGAHRSTAEAVVHAGRDLLDLVNEVRVLRDAFFAITKPAGLVADGARHTFRSYGGRPVASLVASPEGWRAAMPECGIEVFRPTEEAAAGALFMALHDAGRLGILAPNDSIPGPSSTLETGPVLIFESPPTRSFGSKELADRFAGDPDTDTSDEVTP